MKKSAVLLGSIALTRSVLRSKRPEFVFFNDKLIRLTTPVTRSMKIHLAEEMRVQFFLVCEIIKGTRTLQITNWLLIRQHKMRFINFNVLDHFVR